MTTAYITHPSGMKHNMGAGHPECPQRLAVIQDRLLTEGLLDALDCVEAPAATREQLLRVHPEAHVQSIQDVAPHTAEQAYARIDPDTLMNHHTLTAAYHAAGAAVEAVDRVMDGRAKRAFCAVRPPGHHAEAAQAMGFCFFNNVAVGAAHAMAVHGVQRLALIDFDVHHGNGTEDIFANVPGVLMCSTFQSGLYPFLGDTPMGANMVNVPLTRYSDGRAMREAVTQYWLPALHDFAPQLIMISAGFDAHRADELGQLGWVDADYRWISQVLIAVAKRHAQGRIVSCLEGGYDLDALARCVALHVRALADLDDPVPDLPAI
jgi:acetoin utilization deacetylase AcuC-like enzyme